MTWRALSPNPAAFGASDNDLGSFTTRPFRDVASSGDPPPAATGGTRPNRASSKMLSLRLNLTELGAVQQLARERDVPASALVRGWILQHLTDEDYTSTNTAAVVGRRSRRPRTPQTGRVLTTGRTNARDPEPPPPIASPANGCQQVARRTLGVPLAEVRLAEATSIDDRVSLLRQVRHRICCTA